MRKILTTFYNQAKDYQPTGVLVETNDYLEMLREKFGEEVFGKAVWYFNHKFGLSE